MLSQNVAVTILISSCLLVRHYAYATQCAAFQREKILLSDPDLFDDNNNHARFVQKEKKYTIQMIDDLSELSGQCYILSNYTVGVVYAVKYALHALKTQSNVTIGVQIHDSCGKLRLVAESGIEAISSHMLNSTCRKGLINCEDKKTSKSERENKIFGVVGTGRSFTTIPLASLLSLHNIPVISYLATSDKLNDKKEYKNFFRVLPSDRVSIKATVDHFKRFNWTYVIGIGSEDDYGRDVMKQLKQQLEDNNMCLALEEYINDILVLPTDHTLNAALKKIKEKKKATVVALFVRIKTGVKLMKLAERSRITKMWIAGGWWKPNFSHEIADSNIDLQRYVHGLMSISYESIDMTPINDFTRQQILCGFRNNTWFRGYMSAAHECDILGLQRGDIFICNQSNHNVSIKSIMDELIMVGGNRARIIDAFLALGQAIAAGCRENTDIPCNITDVLEKLKTLRFHTYTQGEGFAFDENGNPSKKQFVLDTLKFDETSKTLSYVRFGNWTTGMGVVLNESVNISWPYWWKETKETAPKSHCSDDCKPGYYMKRTKSEKCCWDCRKCSKSHFSNETNATKCTPCSGNEYANDNNTACKKIWEVWISIHGPYGMTMLVFSIFSSAVAAVLFVMLVKYKEPATKFDSSPNLFVFIIAIVLLTFLYGLLIVVKPDDPLCYVRNSCFFLLLVTYCVLILVMTEAVGEVIQEYADTLFKSKYEIAQTVFMAFFVLLQVCFLVGIFTLETKRGHKQLYIQDDIIEKVYYCRFNVNAIRLTSAFLPFIIWLIAIFFAFRERNNPDPFYKSNFVLFTCVLMGLVAMACIGTWVSLLKRKADAEIIRCFSLEIFAWTFMVCFIVPRIYVGIKIKHHSDDDQSEFMAFKKNNILQTEEHMDKIDSKRAFKFVENVESHGAPNATNKSENQREVTANVDETASTIKEDSEHLWSPAWEKETIYDDSPPMIRKHR